MNVLPCKDVAGHLTSPFKLFYDTDPDLWSVLYKWGSLGYYRRPSNTSVEASNSDMQADVGIALGRSSHTNGMIFWNPTTQRMAVLRYAKAS